MVEYIDCRARDYQQTVASHLISGISESELSRDEVIIRFKNTSVYWNKNGYDGLLGTFERIEAPDTTFLVSGNLEIFDSDCGPKVGANSINPLHTRPVDLPGLLGGRRLAILVPIYGSPKFTKQIVENLKRLESELGSADATVIFGIDGHEGNEADLHLAIIEDADLPGYRVHRHDRNLGFIGNSNHLFQDSVGHDLAILWTSDVEIEPHTIGRCLRPLIEDPKIALSTPWAFGGHNLQIPDLDLQDWQNVDSLLSHRLPEYPDAETTVGYFMAVDRTKYRHTHLFDPTFENGYGDDSDLYYRILNLGYRGVLVDNACVFHDDGGSFSLLASREDLQNKNRQVFRERWEALYAPRVGRAMAGIEDTGTQLSNLANFATVAQFSDPRIVFVLPTNDRRIGGVEAVFSLCEALRKTGMPASIVCTSKPVEESTYRLRSIHFQDIGSRSAALNSAEIVVATSFDTANTVKSLAKTHSTKAAYFVQGPEYSFQGGSPLGAVMTTYAGFDEIWAVSDFLGTTLERWLKRPIELIPFGPAGFDYYDRGLGREEKSIALQFNQRIEKGADFAAAAIAELVHHGYTFYAFGDEANRGQNVNFTHQLGFLTYSEKVDLFNRVEFVMDTSHFEGLGLILMEGIRCGALPLYRRTGGTAELLAAADCGVRLPDYAELGTLPATLDQFRENRDRPGAVRRCQAAIANHSVETATKRILERINA